MYISKISQFLTRLWYYPSLNMGLRGSVAIMLIFVLGIIGHRLDLASYALMAMPAALLSGLDQPGPKRWQRLGISLVMWGLAVAVSLGLFYSPLPLWLSFAVIAMLFAFPAINGPFWARLGVSSLYLSAICFSLFNQHTPVQSFPVLLLGPTLFALFSWLWFVVWQNLALRSSLAAIYNALATYIALRQRILLGEADLVPILSNQKHHLVDLFSQTIQSSISNDTATSKRQSLLASLQVASDVFELAIIGHSINPLLLARFDDPIRRQQLMLWSQHAQQILHRQAKAIQSGDSYHCEHQLSALAQPLVASTIDGEHSQLRLWGRAIIRISQVIENNKPLYQRQFQVQPFELTWRWPSLRHPIWRYVARMGIIFAVGSGIAQYFQLLRPEWVVLTMVLVLQPGFVATKSRVWQRCIGTIGGLIVAVVVIKSGLPVGAMQLITLMLVPISLTLILRYYVVAVGGFCAVLILALELLSHQGLALILPRLIDCFVGAMVVLLGITFLWPQWRSHDINNKATQGIINAGVLLNYAFCQLKGDNKTDFIVDEQARQQLMSYRKDVLMAEHDWELVFNEMRQEPKRTHQDSDYQQQLLEHYHQLVHYLCILVSMLRKGVVLPAIESYRVPIEQGIEALVIQLRDGTTTTFPHIDDVNIELQDESLSADQMTVRAVIMLSAATLKHLHQLESSGELI
ncbi:FUSC family protein [Photobacterium phosphoreum]|uniref:FUSC family protein n=1 Tax=Photobacterium phosphoreum TaxID=659 RepID=UPI000D173E7D|nr:FUSC family protein [Photobacterium phosphoreum]PSU69396.1 FUSC family protein [Photobacterium phosphoreum]